MFNWAKPPFKLNLSLRQQMTFTLSLVIVGLILLVGLPMILISVQIQQREAARDRQETANQVAQTVSGIIRNIKTDQAEAPRFDQPDPRINFIATQITTGLGLTTARVLNHIHQTSKEGQSLDAMLAENPQILGVVRTDANGRPLETAWRSLEQAADMATVIRTETFALAQQGLSAQDTLFWGPTYTPVLLIATPVGGEAAGIVIAWVDVHSIWQSLIDLQVGDTGYLYIVDQTGAPVMLPEPFTRSIPANIQTRINSGRPYLGLKSRQVLGHLAAIPDTPWQVIIEIPVTEANAGLRSLLIILGAILLLGLSLAISVGRVFSRWLLQPIQTLQQSALQISNGDLSHRINLNRADELGFLALAFNRMVAALENTITELRTVSLRLLTAEETERRRIAYEIHDELGQTLTALKISLSLAARLSPDNPHLVAAQQMATEAQEKARTLSHELRPAMLDDLGLKSTLEWYINRFEQRANLAISLECDFNEETLPPEIKTTLYRLITEALTNIDKHAHASAVTINLQQNERQLTLTVADDGQGFDTGALSQTHSLGVAGMRERVNLLRGHFLIESQAGGGGTQITVSLPL